MSSGERRWEPGESIVRREVWRGRPEPDFATVLESLDARLDRTLVFVRNGPRFGEQSGNEFPGRAIEQRLASRRHAIQRPE